MPDKEKKPFFKKLLERVKPAKQDRPELPRLFGREPPIRQADRDTPEKERREAKPELLVIEKEPPKPHIGIDTKLTSEWWQTGTVRPGDFHYSAKVAFEPSQDNGIGDGEVFKLSLRDQRGEDVAIFERGDWVLEPAKGSPADKAVQQIVAFFRDNAKDMPHELEPERTEQAAPAAQAENSNPMGFFEKKDKPERASVKAYNRHCAENSITLTDAERDKWIAEWELADEENRQGAQDAKTIEEWHNRHPNWGDPSPEIENEAGSGQQDERAEKYPGSKPDLSKFTLVSPEGLDRKYLKSLENPDTARAKDSPFDLEIDQAKTIGENRHEAGGTISDQRTGARFTVELEWHEDYREGPDSKPSLLRLNVHRFNDDQSLIRYEGGWIVPPTTEDARDILSVIEERYGSLPEKAQEEAKGQSALDAPKDKAQQVEDILFRMGDMHSHYDTLQREDGFVLVRTFEIEDDIRAEHGVPAEQEFDRTQTLDEMHDLIISRDAALPSRMSDEERATRIQVAEREAREAEESHELGDGGRKM
jgi:hypothetical protein